MRFCTAEDVRNALPMPACIELMAGALAELAAGNGVQPLRTAIHLPGGGGSMLTMPAYTAAPRALGVKVIAVFPHNHGTTFPSHQGVVLLLDPEHGSPLGMVDAAALTALRTAAVSAVATRVLALPGAGDLALLGSGVQAESHLEAMLAVRSIRRVRVWSRTPAHADAFARNAAARHGIAIQAVPSAAEAVRGADLICACTAAREPVLEGAWIQPGAHVNAVGACTADARELDSNAVAMARLFVDRREAALHEAGDFLIPLREGAIGESHIAGELGDLLLGRRTGRSGPEQVTLFESLGMAIEDIVAAHHVLQHTNPRGGEHGIHPSP